MTKKSFSADATSLLVAIAGKHNTLHASTGVAVTRHLSNKNLAIILTPRTIERFFVFNLMACALRRVVKRVVLWGAYNFHQTLDSLAAVEFGIYLQLV